MEWKKSPPELIAYLAEAMAVYDCQGKKMFGYPAYFAKGNMFAGLFADTVFVRLSEDDREAILSSGCGAALFEPMPGHAMKEYVVLPQAVYRDPAVFDKWLDRSFQYASTVPPKQRKGKKKG